MRVSANRSGIRSGATLMLGRKAGVKQRSVS
jgi:hypothetical protein